MIDHRFPFFSAVRVGVVVCWLALWVAVGGARGADLLPHSFSRSRQFVVYAREGALRGAIGSLGEDTKNGLLGILGLRDNWKLPIVVDLRAPEPGLPNAHPPVQLILAQTGNGLKVELDLLIGEAGHGTRIRDELVRALLLDVAYRRSNSLPAGRAYTLPPPWLVEGLSAYLESQENGVSASLFAALLPTLQTMSTTDFIGRDPAGMDSTSHAVYRACAYNLVCLLLRELPGSQRGLVAFLRDLPDTPQPAANSAEALGRYFPELAASPDALAKWWTVGLARLATSDRYQMYSAAETEHRLEMLLTFPGPVAKSGEPPKSCTLADFREFTPLKQNPRLLEPLRVGLIALSGQVTPIYQPIINGYQQIVASLIRNRLKDVGEHLRILAGLRRDALQQRDAIADYVNWYEATQIATRSDAFNDYFQSARQFDGKQKIHRPDAISAYLDSLDTEFQ